MAAEFKRAPDYSVVNPERNWYQIALRDGVVFAEESPIQIIRRFQSESGLRADGVIGSATLSALERVVSAAAAANPGTDDSIYVATIRDDRNRREISEGTWQAMIWASREDLRREPRVLFDGAIRLNAMSVNEPVILPPYGREINIAPGVVLRGPEKPAETAPVAPAPALQETPSTAGTIARGPSTSALSTSVVGGASSIVKHLPMIALGVAGISALGWVIWVAARDEKDSSRRTFDRNTKEYV